MTGTDRDDAATLDAEVHHNYSANLTADALRGKRIGVIRGWNGEGSHPGVDETYERSIAAIRKAGAKIVDKIVLTGGEMPNAEYEVLLYEFHTDLNNYLQSSGAPVQSLAELIEFNEANAAAVMPLFGQEVFLHAVEKGPLTEVAYLQAQASARSHARSAIDAAMEAHQLDALVTPSNGPAWMIDHVNGDNFAIGSSSWAAVSGYPSITVPSGFTSGLPLGLTFIAKPWNEKQLIELAYAFEQATGVRKPPEL